MRIRMILTFTLLTFAALTKGQIPSDYKELYETLFLGVPYQCSQIKAITHLRNSGNVKGVGFAYNNLMGYFTSHDLLDIKEIEGPNNRGYLQFIFVIEANKIKRRRLVAENLSTFSQYKIIESLVEGLAVTKESEQNKNRLLFQNTKITKYYTKNKKLFAVIELTYGEGAEVPDKLLQTSFIVTLYDLGVF